MNTLFKTTEEYFTKWKLCYTVIKQKYHHTYILKGSDDGV
jgi:hypothetical protein